MFFIVHLNIWKYIHKKINTTKNKIIPKILLYIENIELRLGLKIVRDGDLYLINVCFVSTILFIIYNFWFFFSLIIPYYKHIKIIFFLFTLKISHNIFRAGRIRTLICCFEDKYPTIEWQLWNVFAQNRNWTYDLKFFRLSLYHWVTWDN